MDGKKPKKGIVDVQAVAAEICAVLAKHEIKINHIDHIFERAKGLAMAKSSVQC